MLLKPSNDPEKRLIGLQIKDVLTLLSESGQPLTADEISQHVDLKGNKAAFFDSLAKSPKVTFDGCRYSYKSLLYVRDRLHFIRLQRTFAEADLLNDDDDDDATVRRKIRIKDQPPFDFSFLDWKPPKGNCSTCLDPILN